MQIKYTLIDTHTREDIKTYKTRPAANRAANKKNQAYGCYRYSVKFG